MRGEMLQQQHGGFVGPLHVVEQHHQRHGAAQSFGQFQHRIEQVALLLLGRHLLRRRNIRQSAPQLRQQQGDLPCGRAQHVAQVVHRDRAHQLLENLGAGDEWCAVLLVGVAGQRQHAARVPQRQRLFAQPRLAGAGLAADQHHPAAASGRFLQTRVQHGHLLLTADQRCGLRAQQIELADIDSFGVGVAEHAGRRFIGGVGLLQTFGGDVEHPRKHQHQREAEGQCDHQRPASPAGQLQQTEQRVADLHQHPGADGVSQRHAHDLAPP